MNRPEKNSILGFLYQPQEITFFKKGVTTIHHSNLIESYNSVSIKKK